MFHNSTTIWHYPHQEKSFHKENRRSFLIMDLFTGMAKAAMKTTTTIVRLGWTIAKPVRWPFKMAWGGVKKGAEYVNKGIDHTEWGIRYTREAAKGVLYTGIGKSLFEIVRGPIDFVKYNLVDNTRDILKDIVTLKTPKNILRAPINAWEGFREGISETRKDLGDILKNAKTLSPLKTINSTRKAIWSLIKTPFKAAWKPTRAIMDTKIQMATNIKNSMLAYPARACGIPGSLKQSDGSTVTFEGPQDHLREGFKRVKGAHAVATEEMKATDSLHLRSIPEFLGTQTEKLKKKAGEGYGAVSKYWDDGKGKPAMAKAA